MFTFPKIFLMRLRYTNALDWRENGSVSPVRDQGNAETCTPFAIASTLESLHHIKRGILHTLSVQQMIDNCSKKMRIEFYGLKTKEKKRKWRWEYEYMNPVYKYVKKNGLYKESDYPYLGRGIIGKCKKLKAPKVYLDDFMWFPGCIGDKALEALVTTRPIHVTLPVDFMLVEYHGGLYHYPKSVEVYKKQFDCLDFDDVPRHSLVVVGFREKYWIAKNPWGTYWGEDGFVHMSRPVNKADWKTYLYQSRQESAIILGS